jgi:hypothetical protein
MGRGWNNGYDTRTVPLDCQRLSRRKEDCSLVNRHRRRKRAVFLAHTRFMTATNLPEALSIGRARLCFRGSPTTFAVFIVDEFKVFNGRAMLEMKFWSKSA